MSQDTITLDPDTGIFDRRRRFSARGIWTYVFVGLALVVTVFSSSMWNEHGMLSEAWTTGRVMTVLIAAIYGLGLGWMIYPYRPDFD